MRTPEEGSRPPLTSSHSQPQAAKKARPKVSRRVPSEAHQRIRSRARSRAPTKGPSTATGTTLLFSDCRYARTASDITPASFAAVTLLRSACAGTRRRMPDRNPTITGISTRQVIPRVILRVTCRLILQIARRFSPQVNLRLTCRITLRFTQGLTLRLIGRFSYRVSP